jgi:Arc/MetJ family transcription regulator
MRTNIDIDDELLAEAMRRSGLKTKKAAVEEALRLLIKRHRQRDILELRGKLKWEGNLEKSRLDRLDE